MEERIVAFVKRLASFGLDIGHLKFLTDLDNMAFPILISSGYYLEDMEEGP